MTEYTWRKGLTLTVLAAFTCCTALAANDAADYEFFSSADGDYTPVRIVDSESMPMQAPSNALGWGIKMLYKNPDGGGMRILYVPPGAEGALVHYHEFHEWAYNIQGDFTNNESTSPDQVSGPLQRFREGAFLSRPPYSLHGGERGRQPFMASQIGAIILIMEESGVGKGTWTVDPIYRELPQFAESQGQGMRYNPDYKEVTHWSTPRIIDTLDHMPWQPVKDVPGLNIKHLLDDPSHGFRARMWFLEAGAKTPEMMKAYHYTQAHQFNFVIAGDLNIQTESRPGKEAETYAMTKHYMVERQPMSIFGLAEENATGGGAVWLEVTYAKGTRWTEEPMFIEEPIYSR